MEKYLCGFIFKFERCESTKPVCWQGGVENELCTDKHTTEMV